jgi:hypothetical protein
VSAIQKKQLELIVLRLAEIKWWRNFVLSPPEQTVDRI